MLHSAALNTIPKTSGHFPKRPVPWWSPVCTTAVWEKRAAFSRLRHNRGDPTLLEDFRWARARTRRVLKEARCASWKAYVFSINTKTPLKCSVKFVRWRGNFLLALHLYLRIWLEGVFPSGWKAAIILPFPKLGKDSSVALNY
ncbi:hypothetical protein Pcinc_006484 [Petrolisthes cinctipes]|uniref:Uncharacterized protein n=1 Tax=Petrolisthes cinctipes TaxID=88211 RepID=A0AAE1GBF4_PETCI|nr:hypothetical protein Pcinc_006484 [Petrolisthes cinctipes]